jgi:hypothetical protein
MLGLLFRFGWENIPNKKMRRSGSIRAKKRRNRTACTICFPLGMRLTVDSPLGCSKSVEFSHWISNAFSPGQSELEDVNPDTNSSLVSKSMFVVCTSLLQRNNSQDVSVSFSFIQYIEDFKSLSSPQQIRDEKKMEKGKA